MNQAPTLLKVTYDENLLTSGGYASVSGDEHTTVRELKDAVRRVVEERGWERYHNLKDLAIALAVEAAELLDVFKWRDPGRVEGDERLMGQVRDELADVLIYALRLADVAGIDVSMAIHDKLRKNAEKYPLGRRYEW